MSLFQSNLRKQIRNLPKILNFVKKIHYYSELFTSLLTCCTALLRWPSSLPSRPAVPPQTDPRSSFQGSARCDCFPNANNSKFETWNSCKKKRSSVLFRTALSKRRGDKKKEFVWNNTAELLRWPRPLGIRSTRGRQRRSPRR